jgi:hypothetical protein
MLTYYRTSRSSHFPFWAVCSLSGSQPEIWSVSWNPPVHRIAFRLFVAFLSINVPAFSQAKGEGAPGSSGPPVHSGQFGPRVKSDLRNHQAIVQPRLYDCLMVTQITLLVLKSGIVDLRHRRLGGRVTASELWPCATPSLSLPPAASSTLPVHHRVSQLKSIPTNFEVSDATY